jgi:hypothetical protein
VPSQYSKRIGEIDNQSMGACEGAFLPPILWKQCHPSALQTINCTPTDYQLQKNLGQTTDRNRARLHSLFGMKFTQVPAKNTATDLQNKPCRPTIQLPFTFDHGTERWRKVVMDNLWRSHIDRHWLASIWSVGSRWLSPKQPFAIWQ